MRTESETRMLPVAPLEDTAVVGRQRRGARDNYVPGCAAGACRGRLLTRTQAPLLIVSWLPGEAPAVGDRCPRGRWAGLAPSQWPTVCTFSYRASAWHCRRALPPALSSLLSFPDPSAPGGPRGSQAPRRSHSTLGIPASGSSPAKPQLNLAAPA